MQSESRYAARRIAEVKTKQVLKIVLAAVLITALGIGVGYDFGNLNQVQAQAVGYRYGQGGLIFSGIAGGICGEPSYNSGADACIQRVNTGQLGQTLGNPNIGWAYLAPPPVIALATATTGGTIPDGTSYRLALSLVTINGGQTNITSTQEATQTTTGGGLSTITATAPIASAGAAGYAVYSTNASGVGNSNATLTELQQPITTAVCAGAFAVNGPSGPGTGQVVCPFGTNAVFTSLLFAAAGNTVPNIPGTQAAVNGGQAIPATNTAAYPSGIPELVCNMLPQTARATITTIQPLGSCVLQPNIQNTIGRVLHIKGYGVFTSGAQTGTMTISMTEGGITPCTVTSPAIITGGQTNSQFSFECYLSTNSTGSAATLTGVETLGVNLATANNVLPLSINQDNIHGVASSAINLTVTNTLVANITMSSSTTSAQLTSAFVYLEN